MPRHPNYIWEQLAADDLHASLIADGFHLPEAVLKVFLRVKGEKALLVSDSVALAGMPPGTYSTPVGGEVVLTPEGRLHTATDPRILAGSAQPMIAGIAHLVRSGLADLAAAWEMASLRPLALLGGEPGGMVAGAGADFVVFRWDGAEIGVERVIAGGVAA
jgi:N-acetylglucosamine-6-phosphate deacetylase